MGVVVHVVVRVVWASSSPPSSLRVNSYSIGKHDNPNPRLGAVELHTVLSGAASALQQGCPFLLLLVVTQAIATLLFLFSLAPWQLHTVAFSHTRCVSYGSRTRSAFAL